jgi:hypothetical protein
MPQLNVAPGSAEVGGASAPESAGWPLQGKRVWGWASVLAGIAALALTLRLWNAASFPIFLDEASYSRWAHDIWAARTRSALLLPVRDDGKTPLFFIIQALGFALTGDVLQAGRVLSAASGTVTVVLTGLLGARLYSPHLGLAAAACYALLPAAVLHERLALPDTLLTALSSGLALAAATLATAQTPSRAGRYGMSAPLVAGIMCGLAAVSTKASGVVLAPYALAAWLAWALPRRERRLVPKWRDAALGALALAPLAAYAAWSYGPWGEPVRRMAALHSIELGHLLDPPLADWAENFRRTSSYVAAYLPGLLWLVALVGLALPLWSRRRADVFLALCALAIVLTVAVLGRSIFSRYYLPALPFLTLLGVRAAIESGRMVARRLVWWNYVLASAGALGLAFSGLLALRLTWDIVTHPEAAALAPHDRFQYISGWPSGYGLAAAVQAVRADAAGRRAFVLTDHYIGLPRDYVAVALAGNQRLTHYVEGGILWGDRAALLRWRSHGVLLYIIANRGRDNVEALERALPDATLIGRYPKPGGTSEYVVWRIDVLSGQT